MSDKKLDELKLNYSQILLLGFGFLASSLTWAVYNAQVPLILRERFMLNSTLIGTVMTIDNFFGIIFQPLIGAWSDNTHTRIGRRLPWILFSLPLCAILFTLIPLQTVLWMFMLVVIGFNLMMSLWRSPVVALMADVTPAPLRSQANGMINLLGGVGAITALFFGGYLSDLREDKFYAFLMAAVVMLFVLLILGLFIRDPASLTYREINKISTPNTRAYQWDESARQDVRVSSDDNLSKMMENNNRLASLTAFRALPAAYKRSLTALLGAVFAWFLGLTAVETFFTLYATHAYHLTGGQASRMLAGFSLTFLICAVPAGLLGQKIGRKKTIFIGLIGLIIVFIPILNQPPQWLLQSLLFFGAAFWACININSLPMVLAFSSDHTTGTFTGYYYVFSFTAAIINPIFYGWLQDLFQTNDLLFLYALVCLGIASVSFYFVQHGENI